MVAKTSYLSWLLPVMMSAQDNMLSMSTSTRLKAFVGFEAGMMCMMGGASLAYPMLSCAPRVS